MDPNLKAHAQELVRRGNNHGVAGSFKDGDDSGFKF